MKHMSMRQRVGQQEIEQFLVQVGRTRQPGRLYLTGGAALVHRGIRPGQTLDIDIQITADPANLTAQVAQLKQQLNINIEFASPGDFIPLPTQWETRSQFIKRYNHVDVFYFDWYSLALSKMQRANRQDVVDVQLLKLAIPLMINFFPIFRSSSFHCIIRQYVNCSRRKVSSLSTFSLNIRTEIPKSKESLHD